jgi:lantibiotic transport system permease protein
VDREDPIERRLNNMAVPELTNEEHKNRLRLALLDARRSAGWGTLLVLLPALFLLAVFLQYGLGIRGVFDPLDRLIFAPIRASHARWLEPLLLFVLPLIALVANLLSITHFRATPLRGELVVTLAFRKRWWNWIIIAISTVIVAVIFLYVLKGDR